MPVYLQIAGWFVALAVLMSLIEHQVHSRLMHKMPRSFLWRNVAARRRIFTSHAVEHHRHQDEVHAEGEERVEQPLERYALPPSVARAKV